MINGAVYVGIRTSSINGGTDFLLKFDADATLFRHLSTSLERGVPGRSEIGGLFAHPRQN